MTAPTALRQFVAICGGDRIARGSTFAEPARVRKPEVFIMGQCDYIASLLYCQDIVRLCNPFELGTGPATLWAAGKFCERTDERSVVEAYALARQREEGR